MRKITNMMSINSDKQYRNDFNNNKNVINTMAKDERNNSGTTPTL
jgi:hypothetical protein